MERTRNSLKCPLLGEISDIKDNMLPTYKEIMKYYEWARWQFKFDKGTKKEPTFLEIANIISTRIEEIWTKASLPIVSHTRVTQMLKSYHLKYKNLLESYPKIPEKTLEEFRRSSKVLFDISACKCKNLNECICSRDRKVPIKEHCFLIDQRTTRNMIIVNIDIATTNQLKKNFKSK